jgi:hypothetical protein
MNTCHHTDDVTTLKAPTVDAVVAPPSPPPVVRSGSQSSVAPGLSDTSVRPPSPLLSDGSMRTFALPPFPRSLSSVCLCLPLLHTIAPNAPFCTPSRALQVVGGFSRPQTSVRGPPRSQSQHRMAPAPPADDFGGFEDDGAASSLLSVCLCLPQISVSLSLSLSVRFSISLAASLYLHHLPMCAIAMCNCSSKV